MFMGEITHTIDNKNRIAVPSFLRNDDNGERIASWIVTKGVFEPCLILYTKSLWVSSVLPKLSNLSLGVKGDRFFMRNFVSPSKDCEVDGQGRIVIPQNLREYASIERDVLIMGAIDRIEIWDPGKYNEYSESTKDQEAEVGQRIRDLGL